MPCGSVLSVEPANMNYKEMNRLNEKKDGVSTSNTKMINDDTQKANSKNSENVDDDLDTFFDSL